MPENLLGQVEQDRNSERFARLKGTNTTNILDRPGRIEFSVEPTLDNDTSIFFNLMSEPVLTFMHVSVDMKGVRYISRGKIPILKTHGVRIGNEHHMQLRNGTFIPSESGVKAISGWLKLHSMPEVKILISCDKPEESQNRYIHWINNPAKGVIGFEGDDVFAYVDQAGNQNVLTIPLDEMDKEGIKPSSPFHDDNHPSRWIVNELFTVESKTPIVITPRINPLDTITIKPRNS